MNIIIKLFTVCLQIQMHRKTPFENRNKNLIHIGFFVYILPFYATKMQSVTPPFVCSMPPQDLQPFRSFLFPRFPGSSKRYRSRPRSRRSLPSRGTAQKIPNTPPDNSARKSIVAFSEKLLIPHNSKYTGFIRILLFVFYSSPSSAIVFKKSSFTSVLGSAPYTER